MERKGCTCIWGIELTQFANRLYLKGERKGKIEDKFYPIVWSTGWLEMPVTDILILGKPWEKNVRSLGWGNRSPIFFLIF